jgi:deoxyribodipyrimidine photo-lyase
MTTALVWFRRDLRSNDHAALHHALGAHDPGALRVRLRPRHPRSLPRRDRRVEFILRAVEELDAALRAIGGDLLVRHGDPATEIPRLAAELGAAAVYANRDYEPAAIARDAEVNRRLASADSCLLDFKDQVIFERDEVLTQGGTPFSVFTPYKNAWLRRLTPGDLQPLAVEPLAARLAPPRPGDRLPSLAELGFEATDLAALRLPTGMSGAQAMFRDFADRIDDYAAKRDYPAHQGLLLPFGPPALRHAIDPPARRATPMPSPVAAPRPGSRN